MVRDFLTLFGTGGIKTVASGVCISRLVTADGQMAVCKVLVLK